MDWVFILPTVALGVAGVGLIYDDIIRDGNDPRLFFGICASVVLLFGVLNYFN